MVLRAIDLFAGGGGLTVGLKRANFRVVVSVELEKSAYTTYRVNHPEVYSLNQDVTSISGKHLLDIIGQETIDLLAGCPPCQGFTSLTSKYKRVDYRNFLIFEMSRLAKQAKPRAIMMENVPGLATKGRQLYEKFKRQLRRAGYWLTDDVVEVANYGVPQFRRRLVLLGGLGFKIEMPTPTHTDGGRDGLLPWRTVRETISHLPVPITLRDAKKQGKVYQSDWNVVRTLSSQNLVRIKSAKSGKTWMSIPEKFRPSCHQGGYKGFTNVYGRMEWDMPSPTITGGCTTLSKGRFGHPEQNRTISVREAALLQTFSEDYLFDTPYMEHACNIIGNALPCDFAEAVSRQCYTKLVSELGGT